MKSRLLLGLTASLTTLITIAMAEGPGGIDGQGHHYDRMFGNPGVSGPSGPQGLTGNGFGSADGTGNSAAQAITVLPGQQPVTYEFAGTPGGPGGDGVSGTPATGCWFGSGGPGARTDEDLKGAPGGNGGYSGAGGTGGNGANVTITYTNLADLKNVLLNLAGGPPGPSGPVVGAGAPGCGCEVSTWIFQRHTTVCTNPTPPSGQAVADATDGSDETGGGPPPPKPGPSPQPAPPRPNPPTPPAPPRPNPPTPPAPVPPPAPTPTPTPVCHDQVTNVVHYCWPGDPGLNGQYVPGNYGQTGAITLIPANKPSGPDNPSVSVPVGQLPYSATLTLDNWSNPTGAAALFAPGSVMQDQYTMYAGRTTAPVKIVWNAKRQTSDIMTVMFNVSIQNGVPTLSWDTTALWAQVSQTTDASGTTTFSIDAAALPSETTELSAVLSGDGTSTIVTLTDQAALSDLVTTSVYAKVESHGVFWHTHYDADVPTASVQMVSPTQFIVDIGQIYPSANAGDLASGKELRVTLTITRSLSTGLGSTQSTTDSIAPIDQKLQ